MVRLVCAFALLVSWCAAIDMKWTPNGEAPAPYSTKAREAMGMDPAAMAGLQQAGQKAPLAPPGATLPFTLGCLLIAYIANNWKVALALQEMIMIVLRPFFKQMEAKKAASLKAAELASQAQARRARAERLKSKAPADED